MKLYNEAGDFCNATKEQSVQMIDVGWSRTPYPAKVEVAPPVDEPVVKTDTVAKTAPKSSKTLKPGIKKISKRK
jgi:hypothetical protein